jgi:hypothetical protein
MVPILSCPLMVYIALIFGKRKMSKACDEEVNETKDEM